MGALQSSWRQEMTGKFTYTEEELAQQREFAKKYPARALVAKGQPMSSILWRAPADVHNKFQEAVESGHLLDVRDDKQSWIRP